jgi:hypothetical protein
MNHPVWIQHNRTKDGRVSSRLSKETRRMLVQQGLIRLVPSTTEIAKIADAAGAFGAGAQWATGIAIDETVNALHDGMKGRPSFTLADIDVITWKEMANRGAQAVMKKPRDKGSELHETFHLMWNNRLPNPTPDQKRMYDSCMGVLTKLCVNLTEVQTEVEFALDTHGGTADLVWPQGSVGLDWKTIAKPRDVKASEILQIGGYRNKFKFDKAYIVYILQDTMAATIVPVENVEYAEATFLDALDFWRRLQGIKEDLE